MKHRRGQFRRAICWLAAGLMAASLVSCRVRRPLGSDAYVGPARAPTGAPAARDRKAAETLSGKPTQPEAKAAGQAEKGETVAVKAAPAPAPAPATKAAPAAPQRLSEGPLAKEAALLMALKNNQALVVERLTPEIARTWESEAAAVFDPVFSGTFGKLYDKGERISAQGLKFDYTGDSLVGEAGLTNFFPSGTNVTLGASTALVDRAADRVAVLGNLEQLVQSRVGLTVSQALLRGAGRSANLARVRQARIDALASEYLLRGFVEMFVAEVEQAYWDCMLANLQIEIFNEAVGVAEKRLEATQQRIDAGTISRTERWAAEAGLARRREQLIDAQSDLKTAKLRLLRMMNPGAGRFWEHDFELPQPPNVPNEALEPDPAVYVEVAMRMRPDLNEARLRVGQGTLEVVRTRNGLLPQLDLFVTWGKSGYAESFSESWQRLRGGRYDLLFGVRAQVPLGNVAARAQHERAKLTRRQAEEALENMGQLIQEEVRAACIEIERAEAQVEATRATVKRRQATYDAEVERQNMGRSTEFQVARAHRNLVDSKNTTAQAVIDYLKAFVELHRLTGSLLERRGIEAPGGEPAELK
ncbi:MAG TPA: TolC family protein [Phycisphaerae bacterium]|nr:TolC family protein [Phycisphaerae bacterium]